MAGLHFVKVLLQQYYSRISSVTLCSDFDFLGLQGCVRKITSNYLGLKFIMRQVIDAVDGKNPVPPTMPEVLAP